MRTRTLMQSATATRHFILGTAGHVDHGKTTLIKALTGIDTDRLPEEKARGLTIDLGFAHLSLPSGRTAGIVDVPGHERFLKNMLAGVGGFDMVLLVVDAVESIMPQTREHMEILQQLAIPAGVIALTKVDLVEPDYLEMAHEEVAEFVKGTFLEGAPIVHVSGVTGAGIRALQEAIDKTLDRVPRRAVDKAPYLPIDRVFIKQGFGTVVTGSLWSGRIAKGDRLVLMPDGHEVKARSLQAYGQAADEVVAGMRVAVNLGGVDAEQVRRGQVVGGEGTLSPSPRLDARLRVLPQSKPLRNRSRVRLYFATEEALGKVILLEHDELGPGMEGMVQFVLDEPVVTRRGDRFVLRNSTAEYTVGGGQFVEVTASTHRRKDSQTIEILRQKEEGEGGSLVRAFLMQEEARPRTVGEVADAVKVDRAVASTWLGELEDRGEVVTFSEGRLVLLASSFKETEKRALELFAKLEEKAPWKTGWKPDEVMKLLSTKPNKALADTLNGLVEHGALKSERGLLSSASHTPRLDAPFAAARDKLLAEVRKNEFSPPAWDDLKKGMGFDTRTWAVLNEYLLDAGEIVFINKEVWFLRSTLDEAATRIRRFIKQNGSITPAQVRDLLDTTRKYIIPLLEYFDNIKVTKRQEDVRVLGGM